MICNYENKIIKPIKSRCVNIRFYPIKVDMIIDKLKYICNNENLKYTNNGVETISKLPNGDMRKAIINKHIISEGISISLLIQQLYNYIINNIEDIINKVGDNEFIRLTIELSELDNKSIISTFSDIYIIGLISIFKK